MLTISTRCGRRILSTAMGIAIAVSTAVAGLAAQDAAERLAGRRLDDALHVLQSTGLRIVFSSELVTPEMRVRREPRARTSRDRLIEILDPHGLGAKDGPDETIVVVRKPRSRPQPLVPSPPATPAEEPAPPGQVDDIFHTDVMVITDPLQGADLLIGSSRRLDAGALSRVGSRVADDPVRTLQTLPGVSTGTDFQSELSVRGSAYRHAAIVIDGVPAPWLQHAAVGRVETGTLTMLRTDVVQDAALSVGAYARRDGGQLGPQVTLTLREGSRETMRWSAGASDSAATLTGEGPIGGAKRGSWLVGLRKSYVEWPLKHDDHQRSVFGFSDLQAKAVYDAHRDHQLSISLVAGVSNVERDDPVATRLGDGINEAALVSVAARSALGTRTVVRQRASFQAHAFENRDQAYKVVGHGSERSKAYRVDLTQALKQNVLEAGVQVRRTHGLIPARSFVLPGSSGELVTLNGAAGAWWERAGYASFRWNLARDLVIVSGLRLADATLGRQHGVDRWVQVIWSRPPGWRLFGSSGVAHQFAALDRLTSTTAETGLRPERATYVDVGVERAVTSSIHWKASIFTRQERDLYERHLVAPLPPVYDTAVVHPPAALLAGNVRGFDVSIERSDADGLTGWVGYTFTIAQYTDEARNETFRADLDQRHLFTLTGSAPAGTRSRVGLTFRAGSSTPIPGYLVRRDLDLFLGDAPNRVESPAYARLDLRAEQRFDINGLPLTAFVEVINLLNHANFGLANGFVDPGTGRAIGFTERLYSRLLAGGFRLDF